MVSMRGVFEQWQPLEHGPLRQLADNLWYVHGALPPPFSSGRRGMTIVRDEEGALLVHNPIALRDDTMAELDGLGPVCTLVVPSASHRLDSANFARRYPGAKVHCPRDATARVAEVVAVEADYEAFQPRKTVRLQYLPGVRPAEGVMQVVSDDGITLVFNDLLHNLLRHPPGLFGQLWGRLAIGTGRAGLHRQLSRKWVEDAGALAEALRRFADEERLRRVIVAHGHPALLEPGRSFLSDVAARL